MRAHESFESLSSANAGETDFAAFVGLDWADQKHSWKLAVAGAGQSRAGELDNTPEQLQAWAMWLHAEFGGRPVAVCVEQSRGAVVFQLRAFPHIVVFPAHPAMAAKYRAVFFPSGSKSDPVDSSLLLELVLHHRDRLRRLDPDTIETRLLQSLAEQRRKWVKEKTRLSNRLTACLKTYFPQVLRWIDDIDSPLGCALLAKWPTLQQLQHAHPGTLARFFRQHNCRSGERIRERLEAIYQAQPAVSDPALLRAGELMTQNLVKMLETLRQCITALDEQLASLSRQHAEAELFAAVPGAGPVLRPRLIAAFGTQRERYATAAELQAYSGIAPVTRQSGNSRQVQFRRACPQFLRQTFHELALHSMTKSQWARAFYDSQIAKGKKHHAAVRALAYKWIRVLFRCWKDRIPYDEQIYLQAREKRHASLGNFVPPSTRLKWKSVAGFQKLTLENT